MQALADLVGVSAWQTIQQWEKEDGTAPKRERLAAVAKALQTTPERLLFGEQQARGLEFVDALVDEVHRHASKSKAAALSEDARKVATAFDQLNRAQKAAVITQLQAFGVLE